MRIQTIHRNPLGEVVNEIRADAVRFEDEYGNHVEISCDEDGELVVRAAARVTCAGKPSGRKSPTCYECGRETLWLAPDSRCGNCTRLTPDEVRGT